jgi:glycine cleavage system H protein
METLTNLLTDTGVFLGGLVVRLLLFVTLFTLFSLPIVAALYAWRGWRMARERLAGAVDVGGIAWRPAYAYAPSHTWLDRTHGRSVRVGLDGLGSKILAGANALVLPPPGTRLHAGEAMAEIRCGGLRAAVPAPLESVVLQANAAVARDPSLLQAEPYGKGWLLRLRPVEAFPEGLKRGDDAKEWLNQEHIRFARLLEQSVGIAAADGGEFRHPPAEVLAPEDWQRIVKSFLRSV